MTEELFRQDAYAKTCEAVITKVDDTGIYLDRTVFYPTGGGQPGDTGVLRAAEGTEAQVVDTRKGPEGQGIVHILAEDAPEFAEGAEVSVELDWDRRYRLMRMHTCLHLLSAVLTYPVTGGQVSDGKGRLDFDIPEATLDKEELNAELNRLVQSDAAVTSDWITDAELAAQPDLVKTMSVKPPSGAGRVRLIRVEGLDLQPCGGTHVARTSEIGSVEIGKIQKKGRQNRRVSVNLL